MFFITHEFKNGLLKIKKLPLSSFMRCFKKKDNEYRQLYYKVLLFSGILATIRQIFVNLVIG